MAAGNYLLFLVADLGPPKISYFWRLDLGCRKYGLIFGYLFSGGQEPPKISLKPPKMTVALVVKGTDLKGKGYLVLVGLSINQ
jgi:hypothetical protein